MNYDNRIDLEMSMQSLSCEISRLFELTHEMTDTDEICLKELNAKFNKLVGKISSAVNLKHQLGV